MGGCYKAIRKGLVPHIGHLKRDVNDDDVVRLTEIRIKRISKFDLDKAQQRIDALEADLAQVKHDLANLTDFAISYLKHLKLTMGRVASEKQRFVSSTMSMPKKLSFETPSSM